jgi:hypothetical protein
MRLPEKADHLVEWAKELIDECYVSREERRDQIGSWIQYFYMGRSDGQQARYNRIYSHLDRLASMLYSPVDVRFGIEYDESEDPDTIRKGQTASRYLNREFHRCGIDIDFAQAVNTALVKGCMMLKVQWGDDGLESYLVHPEQFGVLREDIGELDRQEAFVHTTWLTKSQFKRLIIDHKHRDKLLDQVDKEAQPGKELEMQQSFFHQVIIGGTQPPVGLGQATGTTGQVAIVSIPSPVLHQKTAARLIRQDELWVNDSLRNDYTTIKIVGDTLVEGEFTRRNLCGVKGEQPFHKVCPNQVDGYFWGMSEVSQIYRLQDLLNDQLIDLTRLTRLKADPPRAATGFSGLTQERYKVLKKPGGLITEENPNAKIQNLAEEIPDALFQAITKTVEYFDDVAGFAPILMGQGDTGVRSSAQTSTLSRNASPRLRDRALLCERQVADVGEFCLKTLMVKEAEVQEANRKGDEFLLYQLPHGYHVAVDLHTSSPIFMEDAQQKAVTLARLGAIDAEDLIRLTHPPHEDSLIMRAKQRAEAQARMLREHPELLQKGKGKK